ncbi:putative ribonuclease H-like domain-containing protein [Tanacetum coccineum]
MHVQLSKNTPNIAGSGPNWLFDIDALTKSMSYKPVVTGNQSNGSAGTKACDNACKARVEIVPCKDYILLPLWTQDLLFSSSLKDFSDAGFKPSGEDEKKDAEDLGNEDSKVPKDNTIDENIVYRCDDDLNMPNLEDIASLKNEVIFGVEADMTNLDTHIPMDVKSAFLYEKIEEEVYVCEPPGFEDPDFPDRVYRVEKALYGLHQAPRSWYETLSTYLLENRFQRGQIDKTLFIKRDQGDILIVQMSSMGELIFFLGLQVKQKEDGIFISQDKYVTKIIKKFRFSDVKTTSTPMETQKPLLKDADGEDYVLVQDSNDYAGVSLDRKSTTGGYQFLGCRLISWQCKKQIVTKIHIDNESTICIVKNLDFHSKTKRIEIRCHFIRDSNEKKLIQMIKIHTDQNVVDLLTKAFDVSRFQYLIASIGKLNL